MAVDAGILMSSSIKSYAPSSFTPSTFLASLTRSLRLQCLPDILRNVVSSSTTTMCFWVIVVSLEQTRIVKTPRCRTRNLYETGRCLT